MRLTSAMLADAAQVTGGKLYVLGGAFDTITARTFPVVYRSLAVVLVAEVGPGDRNRDLPLRLGVQDEAAAGMGVRRSGTHRERAPQSLPAGANTVVPLVGAFGNVRLPKAGGYVFVVDHEGVELARIPFRVRQAI